MDHRDAATPSAPAEDRPPAAFATAVALHRRGRLHEARPFYRAGLEAGPAPVRRASASNLGRIEAATGRFAEAAACFRASLAVDAAQPDVWRELGGALFASGDRDGAAAALREALALRPDDGSAAHLLGRVALASGDPEAALARFDAALAALPGAPELPFARGLALRALGRHREAAEAFARVAALRPDMAEAHNNRGRALHDGGDRAGAAAAHRRALALAPRLVPALLNAASLALEEGRFGEAAAGFAASLAAAPGDAGALAGLVHARQQACDWRGLAAQRARLLERVAAGAVVPPFIAIAAGAPDALQAACAGAWAAAVAPLRRPRPPPADPAVRRSPSPRRTGRFGFRAPRRACKTRDRDSRRQAP